VLSVARTLAVVSLLLAGVAIDAWRMHRVPWGFEATGYVALFSFVFTGLSALSAVVIATVRLRSGMRAGLFPVVLLSAVSLLSLLALAAACWRGC
jgi:hypothetical protein